MGRSATNTERPPEWASALRRQMEAPIGWQLRTESKLPQELPPEPTNRDNEHDPYADIVGTC